MTEANWRELIKEGLLPTATFRGRGQGLGHDALWNWTTYRRLLRVMALRHVGLRLRRYQRLVLWLEGADLPIAGIRDDLINQVRVSVERGVHRDLQSDRQVHARLTAAQRNSLSGVLAPKNDEFLAALNLDGATLRAPLAFLADQLPGVQVMCVLGDAAEVMLGFRDDVCVADIVAAAPSAAAFFGENELGLLSRDINRGRGVMARPKDGGNSVLRAVERGGDELLLNVRDSLLRLDPTVRALVYCVRRMVEKDASTLGDFADFQGPIVSVLRHLEGVRLVSDPRARFAMFCILLAWADAAKDDGRRLRRVFTDLRLDIVLPYLIDHMDELERADSEAFFAALGNMRLTQTERAQIIDILNSISA